MEPYKEFDKTKIIDTTDVVIKGFRVRVRELALIALALVCLLVIITLAALLASAKSHNSSSSSSSSAAITDGTGGDGSWAGVACKDMCMTPPCLKAAAHVTELVNVSAAKPCDNFHAFACGNFRTLHPLEPQEGALTTSHLIYNKNMDKLRVLLEKKISTSPFDINHWDTKLKTFFASCNDHFHSMQRQGRPLLEKVLKPSGGWWALMGNDAWASHPYNFKDQLKKVHVDFWTDVFFTFRVITDWTDWTKRTISIDLSGTGLPYYYYITDLYEVQQNHYKNFIRTIGTLLLRDAEINATKDDLKNRVETFVNDAYSVEMELSLLKANSKKTTNPHALDKRMTMKQLDDVSGSAFSFFELFTYMFDKARVTRDTTVVVIEQEYVAKFTEWIRNLDVSNKSRILNNYMVWRLAHRYAQDLSWDYIHANRQVYVDLTGRIEFLGTWRYCVSKIQADMYEALGALFVRDHFADANKKAAHLITDYVKDALEDSLKEKMHWMSEKTRSIALRKVAASLIKLGYPDYMMKDQTLNAIYYDLSFTKEGYFENLLSFNTFYKKTWNRRLANRVDRTDWDYSTYDLIAEYYNPWRELIIPAGVLQFPIFDHSNPQFMNFGSMGTLVATHLIQAIDEIGNQFMLNGSHYGSWWSEDTTKTYGAVKQCFINAVNNLTLNPISFPDYEDEQKITPPPVNATLYAPIALGESSGIKLAYNAYQKWVKVTGGEKSIPGRAFTNDQMFFVSYAQTYCFNRNPFVTLDRAASRVILEEDVRVNAALAQSKEFQAAFKCQTKSSMVAPKRCTLY